ncbi:hypothetical protein A4A49_56890, partial [Nicotiana attenuata]
IHRMGRVVVKHTYREQNRVADSMAKKAAKTISLVRSSLLPDPPMFANDVFWANILGIEVVRNFVACNMDTISQN